MPFRAILCGLLFLGGMFSRCPAATGWPEGYIVAEDSTSPDGRFALLIPGLESNETTDYLANLQTHQLETIAEAGYARGQLHNHLHVVWAPDSSFLVMNIDGGSADDSVFVLQLRETGLVPTEIGKFIQAKLDAEVVKISHHKALGCDCDLFYRPVADRQIHVRALGFSNRRGTEGVPSYDAVFDGTYDLKQKRWKRAESRPLNDALYTTLFTAISPPRFSEENYFPDDRRAVLLDTQLNLVYEGARFFLPAKRFAQIKGEQIAWLKLRDAAATVHEKCTLLEARIVALQDLLW
jgi:hypothetical protein